MQYVNVPSSRNAAPEVLEENILPVNTARQIGAAEKALRRAGEASAVIWRTPATLAWIRMHGDPDGVETGQRIYAETRGRKSLSGRGRTARLAIPVSPWLRARIVEAARRDGQPLATWCRQAIEGAL